jgi:hypothetical protein
MHSIFLKKLASLFLIVTILAASGLCSCLDSHAAEQSSPAPVAARCDAPADHCPACPDGDHSGSDQCPSSCYCSCHLPLTMQTVQVQHSPVITELVFFESFIAIPEVYLPKFIPPQNLA